MIIITFFIWVISYAHESCVWEVIKVYDGNRGYELAVNDIERDSLLSLTPNHKLITKKVIQYYEFYIEFDITRRYVLYLDSLNQLAIQKDEINYLPHILEVLSKGNSVCLGLKRRRKRNIIVDNRLITSPRFFALLLAKRILSPNSEELNKSSFIFLSSFNGVVRYVLFQKNEEKPFMYPEHDRAGRKLKKKKGYVYRKKITVWFNGAKEDKI